MSIQEKLLAFAKETAYPYLLNLPSVASYQDEISVLLVGSVAKGLCTEASDVDMCFLCSSATHKAITQNYTVMCEEPAIDIIENTQLHYWAIGYDYLAERIQQFDEILLDGYGNALVLNDNSGLYAKIRQMIFDKDAQAKRKQLVAANLIEANEELNQALTTGNDPVYRISTGINVITSLLKAIALSDNILYDPQKRLYTTALAGKTGKRLSGKIDRLLASLTEIGKAGNATAATMYMQIVADCMTEILPIT